jgi:hypothetical protein
MAHILWTGAKWENEKIPKYSMSLFTPGANPTIFAFMYSYNPSVVVG